MERNSIHLFLSLLFLIVASGSTSFSQAQGQNPRSVVGKWTLTSVSDRTGRDIEFSMDRGQLAGAYVTSRRERKPIRNAKFNRGGFNFDVPDLKLHFEMRFVRDNLEGKMTAYSTTEKRAAQPVKMVRKRS